MTKPDVPRAKREARATKPTKAVKKKERPRSRKDIAKPVVTEEVELDPSDPRREK